MSMSETKPLQEPLKKKRKWTRVGTPPRRCQICGDGAYGYNYGAITCESCKAFFRRHLNKPDMQPCPGVNNCEMTKKTRKYCPSCRIKKCIHVGMRPEVNPLKRDPTSIKSDSEQTPNPSSVSSSQQVVPGPALPTLYSCIESDFQNIQSTSSSSSPLPSMDAKIGPITGSGSRLLCVDEYSRILQYGNSLMMAVNEPYSRSDLGAFYDNELPTAMEILGHGETVLKRFVRFAKKLPDFADNFTFDEKMLILKKTLFTIHILNGLYTFVPNGRTILLDDGRVKFFSKEHVFGEFRKIGLMPRQESKTMCSWGHLNSLIREKFPQSWPMITAALAMLTLFSPDFYDRPSLSYYSNADDDKPEKQLHAMIITKLIPLHAKYALFLQDYIAHSLAEQGHYDANQVAELHQFCMQRLFDFRAMSQKLHDGINYIVALDPATAVNAFPLCYEIRDSTSEYTIPRV